MISGVMWSVRASIQQKRNNVTKPLLCYYGNRINIFGHMSWELARLDST